MIVRDLESKLKAAARHHPVVTVTGPRQSGKTTLCCMAFPDVELVSLEQPDVREFASTDPKEFLRQFKSRVILDEIQRVPELTSYLQVVVDRKKENGQFILTGSNNFRVMEAVSQSLAGRTAVLELLPFSIAEISRFGRRREELFETLLMGGFPALHDRLPPRDEWLGAYVMTYIERDVRQLVQVGNLVQFQTFMRLAAGRTGQLLNVSALGADGGVTHNTARSWLSVLEAGYLVVRLSPWAGGLTSRLVKSHKLYFVDSGLLCYLLGIRSGEELLRHPLRGPIFEGWVVTELMKNAAHTGRRPEFFFFRDAKGFEVDLLFRTASGWTAVEVKSGTTVADDWFSPLLRFERTVVPMLPGGGATRKVIVYGGEDEYTRRGCRVTPWHRIASLAME